MIILGIKPNLSHTLSYLFLSLSFTLTHKHIHTHLYFPPVLPKHPNGKHSFLPMLPLKKPPSSVQNRTVTSPLMLPPLGQAGDKIVLWPSSSSSRISSNEHKKGELGHRMDSFPLNTLIIQDDLHICLLGNLKGGWLGHRCEPLVEYCVVFRD